MTRSSLHCQAMILLKNSYMIELKPLAAAYITSVLTTRLTMSLTKTLIFFVLKKPGNNRDNFLRIKE